MLNALCTRIFIFSIRTNFSIINYIVHISFRPGSHTDLPSFAFLPVDRDSEAYNMNHAKRGKAYIFNHENFLPSLELKARSGTAKDRDNLYMRLRELDFDVTYFNDLTFNELSSEIAKRKTSSNQ